MPEELVNGETLARLLGVGTTNIRQLNSLAFGF